MRGIGVYSLHSEVVLVDKNEEEEQDDEEEDNEEKDSDNQEKNDEEKDKKEKDNKGGAPRECEQRRR